MGNFDVRYHFDPLSLEDCRCEVASYNEVNLLCTLKEFPLEECSFQVDGKTGAVMIKVSDGYNSR